MLRRVLFVHLILVLLSPIVFVTNGQAISPSKRMDHSPASNALQALKLHRSFLNINNLWLPVRNDGHMGADSVSKYGTYPKGSVNILYSDQIIWTGKVKDGLQPELRTEGGYLSNDMNTVPGSILSNGIPEDPSQQSVRVYRYRPDFEHGDLTLDASSVFDTIATKVTPAMVAAVRDQYRRDFTEWPWVKGAPFVDKNANGLMDPGELPGLQDADQVIWFSYNDLDEMQSKNFGGGPPSGIEIQVTLWAYKDIPILQDVIFKRYRMIYRGGISTPANAIIDSMYVTQFADPDIGDSGNDYGGCDSVLGMGFAFNGPGPDKLYSGLGLMTPGIGYVMFQGPMVPAKQADAALFDFKSRRGVRNLPMTSFALHVTGGGDGLDAQPPYAYFFWDIARGCKAVGPLIITNELWSDPTTGNPTTFMCSGDPLSRTGWYAGSGKGVPVAPGDARLYLNSGPFTMAVGDTQEVVLGILVSTAPDGPNNVTYLKYMAATLRGVYPSLGEYAAELRTRTSVHPLPTIPNDFALHQNYPNPFNPSTRIRYSLSRESNVKLVVLDLLGREVRVLDQGVRQVGTYLISWDAGDDKGSVVSSGVYFYSLITDQFQLTRKLLLLR
jgi:hypothetical protein